MGIGLDVASFIGQLVSFLILLGLLIYFGYRPVRKMLEERSNRIKLSLEQAEAAGKEYERAQVEVEKQIAEAHGEARLIIAEAGKFKDKLMQEAMAEARKERQAIIDRTKGELKREREEMVDSLRREFADVTILAAEKVINESLDKEKHRRLIEQALEESGSLRGAGG